MHRDLQAGHQEGLTLGFLMKKCEGTGRAGVEMRGRGWERMGVGLRLNLNTGFED